MKSFWANPSCDLRSLSAFRVTIAIAALFQFTRAPDVLLSANAWSLYSIPDHVALHTLLVYLTYFALACLALGYRTRLASLFSWFLLATYHAAMGFLYSDPVLLSLLLLCTILPVNHYFSVDAAMDRGFTPHDASKKTMDRDRSIQLFSRSALTAYACVLLIGSSFVLASPIKSTLVSLIAALALLTIAPMRALAGVLAIIWLLATNTELSQEVSTLSGISIMIALLPGWLWTKISEMEAFSRRHQLRIYFDQPCGFCRKICYLFCSFMLLGNAKVAPAQSDPDTLLLLKKHDSWVVYDDDGQYYLHWHGVLLLLKRSPLWWPPGFFLDFIKMGQWGKPLYRLIGHSRTVLSNITAFVIPYKPLGRTPFAIDFIAAAVWLLILALGSVLSNRTSSNTTELLLNYVGTLHTWALW